jgi:hypothetical protein
LIAHFGKLQTKKTPFVKGGCNKGELSPRGNQATIKAYGKGGKH